MPLGQAITFALLLAFMAVMLGIVASATVLQLIGLALAAVVAVAIVFFTVEHFSNRPKVNVTD